MAAKKMIWRQQPGIDYAGQSDALIGAVCRYLNVPTEYPTIEGIAAILGLEHVEVPEEADRGEIGEPMDLGSDDNCIQE